MVSSDLPHTAVLSPGAQRSWLDPSLDLNKAASARGGEMAGLIFLAKVLWLMQKPDPGVQDLSPGAWQPRGVQRLLNS